MNEEEIRAMVEQIDREGDISDAKKEELVLKMMERYNAPVSEEDVVEEVQVQDGGDWRFRASQAARNISRDLGA